jgi:hypothetical protein
MELIIMDYYEKKVTVYNLIKKYLVKINDSKKNANLTSLYDEIMSNYGFGKRYVNREINELISNFPCLKLDIDKSIIIWIGE